MLSAHALLQLSLVLPALTSPSLRRAAEGRCGLPGKQTRIVHGNSSEPCRWRWQVGLTLPGNGLFCGGTLIAPGWVLTAAHCLRPVKSMCGMRSIQVLAGTSEINASLSGTGKGSAVERRIEQVFAHPLYGRNVEHDYDFALLKLDKEMPMNDCIGVACLPSSMDRVGAQCQISGWGTLTLNGSMPGSLQHAPVTLLDIKDCEANYSQAKQVLTGSMVCAQGHSGRGLTDSCSGDSGGPLVCEEGGAFVLRGVVSWGMGCAVKGFPGIYSRVQSVLSWVHDVMDQKVGANLEYRGKQDRAFRKILNYLKLE